MCLVDGDRPPEAFCDQTIIETKQERQDRFRSIIVDAADVVYDPAEKPIGIFNPEYQREASLFVVIGLSYMESIGYRKDVDAGIKRGDHGRSWCVMQIHIGNGKTKEGWTGPELISDRKKCFRSGYKSVKLSFGACWNKPIDQRLNAYASGNCENGIKESKERMNFGIWLFNKAPRVSQ